MSQSSTTHKKNKTVKGHKGRRALRPKNQDAAGIDVGSRVHYVAVPPGRAHSPVRKFGCLTPDLHELAKWLKTCEVSTVVMESTGVYWIPIMEVLESYDLEVLLVDARHARNVPGRKSDVEDCQWLQELHTYGLLSPAFRPHHDMVPLRNYWRQRADLVQQCTRQIHHMQKSLEQMNIQLHKVLSDITGLSGMKIIRSVVDGKRDPLILARMRHSSVKNSEDTFVKALTGNYREDHLFALQQALELYDIYQDKIADIDSQIQRYMSRLQPKSTPKQTLTLPTKKTKRKRRKNQPHFDLALELQRLSGVDLTQIDGINAMTAQTIITEQGIDMSPFPSEKHFASHLGLCPNHQITGGKIIKRKSRKVQSRAAKALRVAAQSLHRSRTALGAFFRRMRAKLGPAKAITATAHKLAKLIYRMLKYGQDYVDIGQDAYEQQGQERLMKNLLRQAKKMGCELIITETGEVVS